jgi:heme/copper-type cytochrome/quinol oxidase subunit 2
MQENQDVVVKTESAGQKNFMPVVLGLITLVVLGIAGYVFATGRTGVTQTTPTPTPGTNAVNAPVASTVPTGSSMASASPSSEEMTATDATTQDVQIVSVEAGSFYFKPNEIRVKQGQKVRIVMKSVDMMHDFNITELDVKMPITKSGDTGTVEFVANKKGTFEYFCSVGSHRKMGQGGKLIVE